MEEERRKEEKGEVGEASELCPLSEGDSGISLASKSDDGERSGKPGSVPPSSSNGKDSIFTEVEMKESQPSRKTERSLLGVEDVGMGAESEDNRDCSRSRASKRAASKKCMSGVSQSPTDGKDCENHGRVEENMSIDPDDEILNLDQSVEQEASPDIKLKLAQLATSLSPSPPVALVDRDSTTVADNGHAQSSDAGSSNCEGSQKTNGTALSEPLGLSVSPAVVNKREDLVISGSGEEEDGDTVAPEEVSGLDIEARDLLEPSMSSDNDENLDSDDDDDGEGAGVINSRLLSANQRRILSRQHKLHARRFNRRRQFSSSSDSDDDSDSNDGGRRESETGKESGDDEEVQRSVQEILDKPMPQPNWFALSELRKREYCSTGRLGSGWFREGVQGSVQMVRRLITVERMKGHEGCVNALSFNRIGTLLASGSDDLDIVLWNWQKARPSVTYESGHRSNVFQAKFMPFSGDCHVISCARDGQVRLAELNSWGVCRVTRKLAQHRGAAHKLALELDSPHVFLSCGEDALTYLFDLRQEKPHKLVTAKENEKKVPLYSIHSNPCDSYQFCVGGRDHYIRVYDKRKISEQAEGGVLKKLCPDHLVNNDIKANVTCACYSYNGSEILGTYNDEDIYLFDNTMSDGANYTHKYTGHRNKATVKGVNFYGPKSEFIVSGSDCGNVYFWDKETEAIINFQEGDDTGVINVLEPHPTLPVLATSGLDHDVKLWMPMLQEPSMDTDVLKKTIKKNQVERNLERVSSEPEIGGQMLWFIMHHFRNSARRRMREEGQVLSTSDDDDDESHSDDSEMNHMQCAQS